eukprot:1165982-Karenia_brevis.AAC.1
MARALSIAYPEADDYKVASASKLSNGVTVMVGDCVAVMYAGALRVGELWFVASMRRHAERECIAC